MGRSLMSSIVTPYRGTRSGDVAAPATQFCAVMIGSPFALPDLLVAPDTLPLPLLQPPPQSLTGKPTPAAAAMPRGFSHSTRRCPASISLSLKFVGVPSPTYF